MILFCWIIKFRRNKTLKTQIQPRSPTNRANFLLSLPNYILYFLFLFSHSHIYQLPIYFLY